MQPKSIVFDAKKRSFTIKGDAGSSDVIPSGKASIDVAVKVIGKAGP